MISNLLFLILPLGLLLSAQLRADKEKWIILLHESPAPPWLWNCHYFIHHRLSKIMKGSGLCNVFPLLCHCSFLLLKVISVTLRCTWFFFTWGCVIMIGSAVGYVYLRCVNRHTSGISQAGPLQNLLYLYFRINQTLYLSQQSYNGCPALSTKASFTLSQWRKILEFVSTAFLLMSPKCFIIFLFVLLKPMSTIAR